MNVLDIALNIALVAITVSLLFCGWRLLLGPETTDRLLALDTLYLNTCLLYTSPSPRDKRQSRMPSSA